LVLAGLLFLLWELYVPAIYCGVGFIYYKFLVSRMPKVRYREMVSEHAAIDNEKVPAFLKVTRFRVAIWVILIILSFILGFVVARFTLALGAFILASEFFGFNILEFFPSLGKTYKQIMKDSVTMRYHWSNDFKVVQDILHISLAALIISFVVRVVGSDFITVSNDVLFLNTRIWFLAGLTHCFVVITVNLYIVFFCNMPVTDKVVSAVKSTTLSALGALGFAYYGAENGTLDNNPVQNLGRDLQDKPRVKNHSEKKFVDTLDYATKANVEEYTVPTESKLALPGSRTFDLNKGVECAKDHESDIRAKSANEAEVINCRLDRNAEYRQMMFTGPDGTSFELNGKTYILNGLADPKPSK
jgi:hypothetical protein